MRQIVINILAVIVLSVLPQTAIANIGGVWKSGSAMLSPAYGARTPIIIEKEDLSFDCNTVHSNVICAFMAHYHLLNPTDETQSVLGAFFSEKTEDVVITFNGETQERILTIAEYKAISRAVDDESHRTMSEDDRIAMRRWTDNRWGRSAYESNAEERKKWLEGNLKSLPAFEISLASHGRANLIVRGRITPMNSQPWGLAELVENTAKSRHLLIGDTAERRAYYFTYYVSPIKSWGDVGEINITMVMPADTRGFQYFYGGKRDALKRFEYTRNDEYSGLESNSSRKKVEWHLPDHSDPGEIPDSLDFVFVTPRKVLNGGILIGAGGQYRRNRTFVGQIGYEIAIPSWLLYGLVVESDFRNWITAILQIKMASPWLVLPPSVGIAFGVPFQFSFDGGLELGIRLQPDIMWGPIGIAMPFDLYFTSSADAPEFMQFSVLGQVSF